VNILRLAAPVFLASVLAAGCVFQDVREQQAKLEATCVIDGTTSSAGTTPHPIVVVLARRTLPADKSERPWQIADHFVMEEPGPWAFISPPGDYRLAAFADTNRDLVYQPGEPMVDTGTERTHACAAGGRLKGITLAIPAVPRDRIDVELDIAKLQARSMQGQVDATLGQLTSVGEMTTLDHARFAQAVGEGAMWRPFDFIVAGHAGVWFLERDDPRKTPVLFVHGLGGNPATFAYLIERLDRTRFEPWVYYYPTGVHLAGAADHLAQTVAKPGLRYPHERLIVVAHSMGGLVSRGFLQRYAAAKGGARIPLFVTLSTPWDGHKGAELGVKHAPAVVRVWEDMAPGSAYIKDVFSRPLPAGTAHHLVFTYRRNSTSFGVSDDEAVSVASQLAAAAQAGATRVYGFDDTHIGIFRNAGVSALLNRLLDEAR
jgi:pimeloyl-ACP methyl ester carboxylesterase